MRKWRNSRRLTAYGDITVCNTNIAIVLLQVGVKVLLWVFFTVSVHSSEDEFALQSDWNQKTEKPHFATEYSHPSQFNKNNDFSLHGGSPAIFLMGSDSQQQINSRNWPDSTRKNRIRNFYNINKQRLVKWREMVNSAEESPEEISKKYYGRSKEYKSEEEPVTMNGFTDCSLYPNNTFNSPFTFACETHDEEDGVAPPSIVVHEAAFSNETGDYVYPLDMTQTLRIFLDLTSYATRRYDDMRAEVKLYRRKVGWLGCGWSFVPTFGTLDVMKICDETNPSCPVYPGRQVLEMKMASSDMMLRVLRMVHDDRTPYQLRLRVFNNRRLGEELFCVMFQARIDV